jgi:quercetin dioxygenase-like cupin family protein
MKNIYRSLDIEKRELAPGVFLKTMWGEKIMLSHVELAAESEVPLHSHPHEQAGMVIEGQFEFTIGNEKQIVKEGEFYIIPGGVEHRVVTGDKPAKALDVFSPPREEYKS